MGVLLITDDGEVPFRRPIAGVDPVDDQDLVTKAWGVANLGGGGGGGVSDGDKGDITVSSTGTVWTIDNDAVTYAKIQNVSATDKVLGRSTAGAGVVEEIACTAAGRALIDDADAPAQRTTLGLGTLATQSGTFSGTSSGTNTGDQTITLAGDVTGTGTGSFAATIANSAVTYAKIQNVSATDKVLGRSTAGAGDVEEIACTATGRSIIAAASTSAVGQLLDVGDDELRSSWVAEFWTPVPNANGWNSGGSGAGNGYAAHWSAVVTTTENGIGVIELKTGTTGTGYFGLFSSQDAVKRGQAEFLFEARISPLALSGGGEIFRVHAGMGTSQFSATAPTNTAEFRYDPDTYGDHNWRAVTGDGTLATTDTGVAAAAATLQNLAFIWDIAGTTVTFYIDGTPVAAHTTHISTGRIGPFVKICKISTAASTNSILLVDRTRLKATRSSAR